jgi:transcriptional regulator with XRE-family HTH domain
MEVSFEVTVLPLGDQMRDTQGTYRSLASTLAYDSVVAAPSDTRIPNLALIALREDAGLSQQDLADGLNDLATRKFGKHPSLTKRKIGRWERGEVQWPHPFHRRLLADYFDRAVDDLGFIPPQRPQSVTAKEHPESSLLCTPMDTPDPRVEQEQRRWRDTRGALGHHRRALAIVAEDLYPENRIPGLERQGVLAPPWWLPENPIPLADVSLELDTESSSPLLSGSERESGQVRPLTSIERRYSRYSHAVRDLAPPRLFENRLCFRVLSADWTLPAARLKFGLMGFFDSIDTNEAFAHEMAANHLLRDSTGALVTGKASWRRLAFRRLLGDPFDLRRRPLMGAIGTLTIRAGECPSMVLHQRDGARVAGGGGMVHLLPAGIFQPSSIMPESVANDFSVWRNMQREFAEELLGHTEYDGTGRPIDYLGTEPFATMERALRDGRIRVYYLGLTLDALTLCGDLLTVAVIEPDTYDELFGAAVDRNDEGSIPARALPFEEHTIDRLRRLGSAVAGSNGRRSPGLAASTHVTWPHLPSVMTRRPPDPLTFVVASRPASHSQALSINSGLIRSGNRSENR